MANNAIKGAADAYAVAHYRFYTSDPDEPVPYQQDLRAYKSSEARLDAVINEVISENAKLRKQLAEAESLLQCELRTHAACAERAEAAEAKLKALDEQEPVMWANPYFSYAAIARPDTVYGSHTIPLYARPIPPADVQELQQQCVDLADACRYQVEKRETRITELERKLADEEERHASLQSRCYDQGGTFSSVFDEVAQLRRELAQAREEGRREAVPDVDWLSNVIRTADGSHTLGAGALAEKIVEALLAASPPPASLNAKEGGE